MKLFSCIKPQLFISYHDIWCIKCKIEGMLITECAFFGIEQHLIICIRPHQRASHSKFWVLPKEYTMDIMQHNRHHGLHKASWAYLSKMDIITSRHLHIGSSQPTGKRPYAICKSPYAYAKCLYSVLCFDKLECLDR